MPSVARDEFKRGLWAISPERGLKRLKRLLARHQKAQKLDQPV